MFVIFYRGKQLLWLLVCFSAQLNFKNISDAAQEMPHIMKTCLYNFDPLKPHFYLVKLVFTGVYIIILISAQNHRLWHSLEPPRRGGSNEYPQSTFLSRNMKKKYQNFYPEIFIFFFFFFFLVVKFLVYLNGHVFVMIMKHSPPEVEGEMRNLTMRKQMTHMKLQT